jgi:hypothetical protein
MGLAEIAGRTRQEASRWWDRVVADGSRGRAPRDLAGGPPLLEAFRARAAASFFAGVADESTPAVLAARWPEEVLRVLAGADRSLAGRFDLLGYTDLSFGDPVDWHRDAVAGRRAPLVHGSLLDPLDTASVGDSKVVWELNRHQWMVELGQAYSLTRDERYAEAFALHLRDWCAANPVGRGINWSSSLEAAMRLMAWCWALVLFRSSNVLDPELFLVLRRSIQDHASHVDRYLSHYFSPNTHLTGEALGLFYAGTLFPELPRARRWRDRGAAILVRELERQVLRDGVYFEQSTCYQRYTVEIALHFLILCGRAGIVVPRSLVDRVAAMLDFLVAVRRPSGDVTPIGDSDGGWLLPLARRRSGDFRGVFAVAAVWFGRADYAWAAGSRPQPELLWMLGPSGLSELERIRPAPPAGRASRLFAEGGYAVMREGWDARSHHLVFDVGPLAPSGSGGHAHADLLSIQCAAFGEPFLVDAGTGTYADQTWRAFFRGTAAHNTVTVDGASQAECVGPFGWAKRPVARLRQWVSTEAIDFADAEHDAFAALPDPVRHRRRVLFVKPRYWVIVDDLLATQRHRVDLRFQFGEALVSLEPDGWTRAESGGRGLLLRSFAGEPLEVRLRRGSRDPMEGWISTDYGRCQPAPALVCAATARLPLRVMTLLLPCADPAAAPPPVRPLVLEGRGLAGLVFERDGETVIEGEAGGLEWKPGKPEGTR